MKYVLIALTALAAVAAYRGELQQALVCLILAAGTFIDPGAMAGRSVTTMAA